MLGSSRLTLLSINIKCFVLVQSQTDAILGWVDKNGRAFFMDTWIGGYTSPLLDTSQDIYNTSGRIQDGVTTLSFTRKRLSSDLKVSHVGT
jgi:hypothetical protein